MYQGELEQRHLLSQPAVLRHQRGVRALPLLVPPRERVEGLQPYATGPATVCDQACNRMFPVLGLWLQPYVAEAATVCDGGCDRTSRSLALVSASCLVSATPT